VRFGLLPATAFAGAVHEAAKKGDLVAIAEALDAGADANAPDKLAGPLFYAVQNDHLDAAKLLIDRGADVNAISRIGLPITVAVLKGYPDLIILLLAHGADPNAAIKTQTVRQDRIVQYPFQFSFGLHWPLAGRM
jgi:cytochrome c